MRKIINKAGGFIIIGIGLIMAFLFANYLDGALELATLQLFIYYIGFAIGAGVLYFILSYYFPSRKVILWYTILVILFVADLVEFWPYRGILR